MRGSTIILIEIVAYDPVAAAETTLRFCTGNGFDPADAALGTYLPLVVDPGTIEEFIFPRGQVRGLGQSAFGSIVLNNADGRLDYLSGYGFGRAVTMRRGSSLLANPSDFETIFTGTSDGAVEFSETEVVLSLSNPLSDLFAQPILTVKYSGDETDTTYGANGHVNGTANDLQDLFWPLVIGTPGRNIAAPIVNYGKQTFQLSRQACWYLNEVRNGGFLQAQGTQHFSLADLQAATVSGGEYDYYLGDDTLSGSDPERGTYFRIGGSVDGDITVDCGTAISRGLVAATEDLFTAIGETADISGSLGSTSGGIYIPPENMTFGDALEKLLDSYGGYVRREIDGSFTGNILRDPADYTADHTIASVVLGAGETARPVKLERIRSNMPFGDVPASAIWCNYYKNYKEQTLADLAQSVKALTVLELSATGATQDVVVPDNATWMRVECYGPGGGGSGDGGGAGGDGAIVKATLPCTPAATLKAVVGTGGTQGGSTNDGSTRFGGEGDGASYAGGNGIGKSGAGGSLTGLFAASVSVANALIIAAGGAGGSPNSASNTGGDGGDTTGEAGGGTTAGQGGTQSAGGTAGGANASAGAALNGGDGTANGNAGGAAGYYGGGAGVDGGGGGSNFVHGDGQNVERRRGLDLTDASLPSNIGRGGAAGATSAEGMPGDDGFMRITFYNGNPEANGGAATALQAPLSREFKRLELAADSAVLTKHPTAKPYEFDCYVGGVEPRAYAQNMADRMKELLCVERQFAQVDVPERIGIPIQTGEIVEIEYARYSATGSDKWLVTGKVWDLKNNIITLVLWK